VFNKKSGSAIDNQPVGKSGGMQDIIYGLVNVRSEGKHLLFAVRNEGNKSWAYETIEADEIKSAAVTHINFA